MGSAQHNFSAALDEFRTAAGRGFWRAASRLQVAEFYATVATEVTLLRSFVATTASHKLKNLAREELEVVETLQRLLRNHTLNSTSGEPATPAVHRSSDEPSTTELLAALSLANLQDLDLKTDGEDQLRRGNVFTLRRDTGDRTSKENYDDALDEASEIEAALEALGIAVTIDLADHDTIIYGLRHRRAPVVGGARD